MTSLSKCRCQWHLNEHLGGEQTPPLFAPYREAKSQAYELQVLYSSAKTRHSFTQELLDPQLQNWWHQAEDAIHRGPFQQSRDRPLVLPKAVDWFESSPAVGKSVERGLLSRGLK